jgi:hypothetical protein
MAAMAVLLSKLNKIEFNSVFEGTGQFECAARHASDGFNAKKKRGTRVRVRVKLGDIVPQVRTT